MSDLSGLDQSFALSSATVPPPPMGEPPVASTDIQPNEVGFRRLRGQHEIGRILHLRNEIQLPTSALNDAGFAMREKKETRWGWSAPSSATVNTSVPSGTCR